MEDPTPNVYPPNEYIEDQASENLAGIASAEANTSGESQVVANTNVVAIPAVEIPAVAIPAEANPNDAILAEASSSSVNTANANPDFANLDEESPDEASTAVATPVVESSPSGPISEKLNLQPIKDLMKTIEDEISGMSTDFANKLQILKKQMEEAARLEKEKLEKEELERQERERKAKVEKAERDRIAEEKRLENERRLAEAKRQSEEALRKELARKEEEKRAKAAEEAARQAREEKERKAREETERRAREESERAKQEKIDRLVKEYQDRFNELQNMHISQNNIDRIKLEYKNLKQELESPDTLESLTEGRKLTIINGIIDIIKEGIEKTVGFIKNQPEYNEIFSDIMFIMTSFNSKDPEQQREIIDDVLKDDPINNKLFISISSIYQELKTKFPKFIEFIDNDNYIIEDYSNIIQYIRDITRTNINELQNKLSDLYEIIVGTARVAVRCKPKKSDNTTTGVKYQTFREYFNILLQGMQLVGGTIVQTGGYKYADIFTVNNNNRIKISTDCGDTKDFVNGYGPFYSVYPPQYNNFHIYYNMFGLNKYNFPAGSDDNNTIDKYDKLLENNNLTKLKDNRTFDASGIKNKSHKLMQKLEKGGSVVIFGYGFSGSGKTYALIEGLNSNEHYDPSILEQFIKENSTSIKSVEFLELYPLGISHNPHTALTDTKKIISVKNNSSFETEEERAKVTEESINDITFMKYANECGLTMTEAVNPKNLYNSIDSNISYDNISNRIRLLERHRFSKLRILATPNNDKSSRSFLQITIKLNDVTINEKTKTPKLVLFDMPGTENTVRIKTQFLGEELFSKLKKPMKTIIPNLKEAIYQSGTVGINVQYIDSKYENNLPQFYSYTKVENGNDTKKQLEVIFKNFMMQIGAFKAINVFISSDELIAEDSLEFALFINGLDIERLPTEPDKTPDITIMYNKIKTGKVINFLTEELYIRIVNKFIKFLIEKDDKNINKYFSINSPNENCKISSELNDEDFENIKKIFNVKIDQANDMGLSPSEYKSTFIHFIKSNFSSDVYDLTELFISNDDIEEQILNESIFKNLKRPDSKKLEIINIPTLKNTNKNGDYIKFYFANPLIKYIYLILSYLYKQIYKSDLSNLKTKLSSYTDIKNALPQLFYRSATFFIYKYINFIVNQGRSIVTNLEHLKFFFLTRTGAIKDYNIKNPDKSFVCKEDNCNDLINSSLLNKKEYTKPTKIGKPQRFDDAKQKLVGIAQTEIQERINFGNMDVYGLIDILQKLSSSPRLKDCDTTNKTLNLLKSKPLPEGTMSSIAVSKKDSLLGAIFIMFANYKIFLDNEIDSQDIKIAKDKLDTLCKAAIDTANFTQSISSTSVNQKNTAMIEAPQAGSKLFNQTEEFKIQLPYQIAVGGKRKFNMNQLLEHKNKKPRTHRNLSSKNKKSKVFYNRTKKNN